MTEKPCYDCGGRGLKLIPDGQTGRYNIEECETCFGSGTLPQRSKINKKSTRKMNRELHAKKC